MATAEDAARRGLLRRGFILEWTTLGWNVAGIAVLATGLDDRIGSAMTDPVRSTLAGVRPGLR